MSAGPELRPTSHLREIVLFALALAGGIYAFADKLLLIGRSTASLDKVDAIEAKQQQQEARLIRTEYESAGANAGVQRVESKVDHGFEQVNTRLDQLRVTTHR